MSLRNPFGDLSTEATLVEVRDALAGGDDPLVGIDKGGEDLDGTMQLLVPANLARVKVAGQNASDGRVWIGFGEPAVIGDGLFVEPGGYFEEFTTDDVSVIAEPSTVGRMTWQEWSS